MSNRSCPACEFIFIGDDAPEQHCPECGTDWGPTGNSISPSDVPLSHTETQLLRPRSAEQSESLPETTYPDRAQISFLALLIMGGLIGILGAGFAWQRSMNRKDNSLRRGAEQNFVDVQDDLQDVQERLHSAADRLVSQREATQAVTEELRLLQQSFQQTSQQQKQNRERISDLERALSVLWGKHGHSYLRDWQILGPVPFALPNSENIDSTGFAALLAIETAILEQGFVKEAIYPGIRSPVTWKPHSSDHDRIDIDQATDYRENAAGYSFCWVFSRTPKEVLFRTSFDDGIRLWVNRKQVFDVDADRGRRPAQDRIPVTLREGWNEVLVRTDNRGSGNWNFSAEIRSSDNKQSLKLFSTWIAPLNMLNPSSLSSEENPLGLRESKSN